MSLNIFCACADRRTVGRAGGRGGLAYGRLVSQSVDWAVGRLVGRAAVKGWIARILTKEEFGTNDLCMVCGTYDGRRQTVGLQSICAKIGLLQAVLHFRLPPHLTF